MYGTGMVLTYFKIWDEIEIFKNFQETEMRDEK